MKPETKIEIIIYHIPLLLNTQLMYEDYVCMLQNRTHIASSMDKYLKFSMELSNSFSR